MDNGGPFKSNTASILVRAALLLCVRFPVFLLLIRGPSLSNVILSACSLWDLRNIKCGVPRSMKCLWSLKVSMHV